MEQNRQNTDEIDLKELFLKLVLISKRNFWLILSFFALGTALGSMYYMLAPRQYKSEMIVNSDILKEGYVEGVGELLDNIIADENLEQLSSMLSVSPEEAKKIASIKFKNTYETRNKATDEFYLTITAVVLDQSILSNLQKGLINYLENNEYAKIRVEQSKDYIMQMIKKLDEEIASVESFKTSFYGGSGSFFEKNKASILISPTDINARIIELTKEKISLQNQLINVRAIELIQSFTPSVHPSWPKKGLSLAAGSFFGLVLVFLVIAFKSIRSLVRYAEATEKI
jgi:LPS O-antigen subunit length determinant protein (WzzB/FepE family)